MLSLSICRDCCHRCCVDGCADGGAPAVVIVRLPIQSEVAAGFCLCFCERVQIFLRRFATVGAYPVGSGHNKHAQVVVMLGTILCAPPANGVRLRMHTRT